MSGLVARIRQPALLPSAMRLRDIEPRSNPSDLVAIGDRVRNWPDCAETTRAATVPLRPQYVNDATLDLHFRHLTFERHFGEATRPSGPHLRHECGLYLALLPVVNDIPVFVIQSVLERKGMPVAEKLQKKFRCRIGDKGKLEITTMCG